MLPVAFDAAFKKGLCGKGSRRLLRGAETQKQNKEVKVMDENRERERERGDQQEMRDPAEKLLLPR